MLKTILIIIFLAIISQTASAIDKSLVMYFPLDDGRGDKVTDKSSYQNDGKIFGNAKWADGKLEKCLEFTAGAYVEVPEIPEYDVTSEVSLMAWIKTTSVISWARIIDKSEWQDNGYDLVFHMNDHIPMFEFFVNNTTSQVQGKTKIDDGKWHFIAGTFGNKTLKIYTDGILEGEVKSVNNVDIKPNDWPVRLGIEANPAKGQQYIGLMDEVAMFNRELSANEIENIFKNGINTAPVDLTGKLAFAWGKLKILK